MDSHYLILRPLHTEKSVVDMRANNAYHFAVQGSATKGQIRCAIEEMFPGRKVTDVRTIWVRGKSRRLGRTRGRTSDWKKAIVQLRPGDSIDIGY